jgi:hypothetical protein
MKKNIVLPALLLLCQFQLLAQAPSLAWAKSLKTQVMAGNQIINYPNAVITDASGNVYMTGGYTGTSDFDPGAATANLTSVGNKDIFITKFDIAGNYVWAKSIGNSGNDVGLSIAVDVSGGVYVIGVYQGTVDFDPGAGITNLGGSGLNNSFIAKYNADGSLAWAGALTGSDVYSAGIALDASNNVYVTGYYQGTCDFDPGAAVANQTNAGAYDIFVAKYSSTGTYTWAKKIGGDGYEQSVGIAVDASSNIYITGYFGTTTLDFDPSANTANLTRLGGTDMFMAKYDASGNYVWANNIGGAGNPNVRSIVLDASANIHVAGTITGTADFDPSAATANLSTSSSTDIFFAKYTSAGAYTWAKSLAGSGPDECYSIAVDASSNVYITGYFGGSVDFDPGAATANINASSFDIYMAKYSSTGSYAWARGFGSNANSNGGFAVTVDALGYLLLAGSFTNSIDFDPTAGSTVLTTNPVNSLYNGDIFLAKYNTGSSLPLVSNSFIAKPNGTGAVIEWTTINEQLNERFMVERSDDGSKFQAIATVEGKGKTHNSYLVNDYLPIKEMAYYRLKQVSADGKYSYSKTVAVNIKERMRMDIYPNPVSNMLTVQFNSFLYSTMLLLNEEGKVLLTKTAVSNMQLDMSKFPTGTYFVQLIGDDGIVSKQVIKK